MATTWSRIGPLQAKVVCTGDGAAPSGTTEGLDLTGADENGLHLGSVPYEIDAIDLWVETATNMAAVSPGLKCYVMNTITGTWARYATLDKNTAGSDQAEVFKAINPSAQFGRIAWVPSGLTVASTVYMLGHRAPLR